MQARCHKSATRVISNDVHNLITHISWPLGDCINGFSLLQYHIYSYVHTNLPSDSVKFSGTLI